MSVFCRSLRPSKTGPSHLHPPASSPCLCHSRADTLTNGVQLNLVTLACGLLSSIGALVITVEQTPCVESAEPEGDAAVEYMLHARRQGVTGSKPLPGEGSILQLLKEALAGHASGYSSYTINRKN